MDPSLYSRDDQLITKALKCQRETCAPFSIILIDTLVVKTLTLLRIRQVTLISQWKIFYF